MPLKILSLKYGIASVVFLFLFSLLGIESYQGSLIYYFAFDLSWLAVFLSAFCFSRTYIIFYIQVMLFMGFWLKLMARLILKVLFIEPTGYWVFSVTPASWDEVLLVSSLAACGILSANVLFFLCTKNTTQKTQTSNTPQWYINHNNLAWITLFLAGVITNVLNIFCRISTTGLRPKIILPFHLNVGIIWIMLMAIPLCMATFLGWDQDLTQKKQRLYWVFILAFITSLSTLSRAIYLFWTLPYLLILVSQPHYSIKELAVWKNKKVILLYVMFIILSLVLVSVMRTHSYTTLLAKHPVKNSSSLATILGHQNKFSQLKKLVVGRWIGLEAIMATHAFPESGWTFLKESILEKPYVGDTGIYTRVILKLHNYEINKKAMFSSLPGLVGILNYAHSRSLIFVGMIFGCFFLCCIEWISYRSLKSEFLLSQQGLILAYWCVSGLNIPYLGLINLFECLCVTLLIGLINPCYNWFMNYSLKKSTFYPA